MSDLQPRLRGLTRDDLSELNDLMAAIEAVDRTGEHYGLADLEEEWENPLVDPGKDFVGAFADGQMVGVFRLFPRMAANSGKVYFDGGVHPAHRGRGIGTVLVPAMVERGLAYGAERGAEQMTLSLTALSSDTDKAALLADVGLLPYRYSFVMRAALDGPPRKPSANVSSWTR